MRGRSSTAFLGRHPDHEQAGAVGRERDLRRLGNDRLAGDDREAGKTGTRDPFDGLRANVVGLVAKGRVTAAECDRALTSIVNSLPRERGHDRADATPRHRSRRRNVRATFAP